MAARGRGTCEWLPVGVVGTSNTSDIDLLSGETRILISAQDANLVRTIELKA
jgi:hypothetical protein